MLLTARLVTVWNTQSQSALVGQKTPSASKPCVALIFLCDQEHFAKNWIWHFAENLSKKNCKSINLDSTLLIIPNFSRVRNSQKKIGNSLLISPRIPVQGLSSNACHSGSMYVCQCNDAMTMSYAATVLHFTMVQDYMS
jgi:hypothetical protein